MLMLQKMDHGHVKYCILVMLFLSVTVYFQYFGNVDFAPSNQL